MNARGHEPDPVCALYDRAAELVEAAAALRARAAAPGAAAAAPAVLGCVEEVLRDLAGAAGELGRACDTGAATRRAEQLERMRAGFGNVEVALSDAAASAAAARSLAARVVHAS